MAKVFKINGVDMTPYLMKDSRYSVKQKPVYALKFTDTEGVDHAIVQRWKSELEDVQFRILNDYEAATVYEMLTSGDLSVTYYNPKSGEVTQNMIVDDFEQKLLLDSDRRYWNGGYVSFTEK